jgi:hypothetical protein
VLPLPELVTNLGHSAWTAASQKADSAIAGLVASGATLLCTGWWRRYVSGTAIRRREAFERVNVSLNYFDEETGTLRIRTVIERPLEEVIHNLLARTVVQDAAKKTTAGFPIIVVADHQIADFALNCFLNTTAGHFSERAVRPDLGFDFVAQSYAICLTCERPDIKRQRKIRALIIREETLKTFPFLYIDPKLEAEEHRDRLETLRLMVRLFKRERAKVARDPEYRSNIFGSLELGS